MSDRRPASQAQIDHCRRIAMLGGLATKAKYANASGDARAYYRAIGKLGFQAYADAHHSGNRKAALKALGLMHSPSPQPLSAAELASFAAARAWLDAA